MEILNDSACFNIGLNQKALFQIGYFLKGAEENFVSVLVVRPRRRAAGSLVPAKFMTVAKVLTVATFLTKL